MGDSSEHMISLLNRAAAAALDGRRALEDGRCRDAEFLHRDAKVYLRGVSEMYQGRPETNAERRIRRDAVKLGREIDTACKRKG